MKSHRFFSLFLVLAIFAGALLPSAFAESVPTITVAGPDSVNDHWGDTLAIQELQKRTGLNWDITLYPGDVWQTRLTLLIASDELPDVIFKAGGDKSEMNLYGEEGYFLDISQYLDSMPNLQKTFEEHPDYKAYHTAENGAIYSLSTLYAYPGQRIQALVYLNQEWLDTLNLDYPNTVEELYDVLKAFKEGDPNGNGLADEIPLSYDTSAGQRLEFVLRAGFGIYSMQNDLLLQIDGDGQVFIAERTENYRNFLSYMRRLYAEGLMDETTFIQTESERREKILNHQVGMFSDWGALNAATCGVNGPDAYKTWSWVNGMGSAGYEKAFPANSIVQQGANIMVNANTEYPLEICKMIDYLFTDDYVLLYNYGVEGETFEFGVTESGFEVPIIKTEAWEGTYDSEAVYKDQAICVTQLMTLYYHFNYMVTGNATDAELESMLEDPVLYDHARREQFVRTANFKDTYPVFPYNSEEAEVKARYQTDLQTYLNTMRVAFITGEANLETDWDNFLSTMEAMGVEELLAAEQSAYDRYAANLQ